MSARQQPIELIHARSLLTKFTYAAFLVERGGRLLYFNDAAGEILGLRFEEAGPMEPEEWGTRFEPAGIDGERLGVDDLPLTVALRAGRPGHMAMRIRSLDGTERQIEVTALPLLSRGELSGAIAIFWPLD